MSSRRARQENQENEAAPNTDDGVNQSALACVLPCAPSADLANQENWEGELASRAA